ncbi:hypothetical protein PIB30_021738 [Stylosanthes scabra]|uniref:Uncharacterized protein n=1 Tax=Stylosanthes scabra TaxID=79078 RepID=A0ABU6T9R6_9FABA|nr:hypothetical protein [Stylosanthes scabra]
MLLMKFKLLADVILQKIRRPARRPSLRHHLRLRTSQTKASWSPLSAAVPLSKPSISVSCTAPRSPSLLRLPSPAQPEAAHKQQQNLAAAEAATRRSTTTAVEPNSAGATRPRSTRCVHIRKET